MAERQIRIEIVPFPEPADAPVRRRPRSGLRPVAPVEDLSTADGPGDDAPAEDVPADEVPAGEAPTEVDELGIVPTPVPTPGSAADGPAPLAVVPVEPEPVEPEPEEPEPEAVEVEAEEPEPEEPEPVAVAVEPEPEEPEPEAVEAEPEPEPESDSAPAPAPARPTASAPPAESVAVDEQRLRAFTVSGRLLFLTLAAVLLAAIISVVAISGVARVSDLNRRLAAVSAARQLNADATSELRVLHGVAGPAVADAVQRLDRLAAETSRAAAGYVPARAIREADRGSAEYAAARSADPEAEPSSEEFASAAASRNDLDAALAREERRSVDRSDSARTAFIAWMIVLFALGGIALVTIGRQIGRSLAVPMIRLGRSVRRFGEGDLRVRAEVAPDEIGTLGRSFNTMADAVAERVRRLNAKAQSDEQLRRTGDALDLAETEAAVYEVLDQALEELTPGLRGELLVSETSSTRLTRVSANPAAGPAGCPVETSEGCPAMRRAQALTFEGPGAIDACPKLREHPEPCAAACVPVGVNGHLLGVLHVTTAEGEPPEPETVEHLVTLAGQVGTRVGALRTLESTRLEASTDGLTGLANRRMLEARLAELLRNGVGFSLAVADLDNFKQLNDTHGHPVGDRALQLFAKVLEDNVRGHDVVARYGGEEFVLVYPELTVNKAMEVIERIRQAVERAVAANGLPPFTCSFGVTHSSVGEQPDAIIRVADAGLLVAKERGRDRVVYADQDLADEVFASPARRAAIGENA